MTETRHTFCRICESLCGLEVDVDASGRIEAIRPDPEHVETGGFACVKGLKQDRLYGSPDRLRYPMKRVGDRHERISWEQALREIGEKVRGLRGEHGPDSIGMYVGTAAGFSLLHPIFAQGFMNGIGSKSVYASSTQDCSNKFAVAREVYGFPFTQPFPDLDHLECLVIVGANPMVSKWSFLQVPNPGKRLREIEARGGRIFVVDPRRTETAKIAGEHVFIRPGMDVFFYLSFLNELIATGGVDEALVRTHTRGFETVRALAAEWPPERTAEVTRIEPGVLREMVRAFREAKGAALYSSTGVNMGGHGALAFWIQEVINAVSGNLDRKGGTLLGRGIVDFAKFGARSGFGLREDRSRIGGFASVNDAYPGGILADEILTPGEGQLRALFVTGGNPLITMAGSDLLREAFASLELLVTIDILPNETGALAHYMLPATTPFERPDLPFAFPLLMGMQSHPYLQATEPVHPPDAEQRDEASIYVDLARACDAPLFGSRVAQRLVEWSRRLTREPRRPGVPPSIPQAGLMSLLLRLTGHGSFRKLLGERHGRRLDPQSPGVYLGKKVAKPDGRIDLAPVALARQATTSLETTFDEERRHPGRLKLITKRHVKTHNSWTHNEESFVAGARTTNHVYMHPEDAKAVGLRHGDLADVRSAGGVVRIPVQLLDDLQPGTVAIPHGWGHQHARGLSVASRTTGVNVNVLAESGPDAVEALSGMSRLTAIPVDVTPAAGPLVPESWTGMAAHEEVANG
ncbi:MAG TPA: molybdopterin-dependent oxidoreductase [Myxococcota bacterium]|nr:molybdopterin-dependent oxidoreductase [Myxococcales bacterium]HPG24636.1 molybdopterin-dependent oxidoreductase [Myxococcota bacterium]